MPESPAVLLSCEHGGNRIPRRLRSLFRAHRRRLAGHQGYDIGALACARALGRRLDAPLIHAGISRLLVDLNRSPHHRALFSDVTRTLPAKERQDILVRYYHPHRQRIERWIHARISAGHTVLHIAIHSFTPVMRGERRRADVGLLYDPRRMLENRLCRIWKAALSGTSLVVRRNYPYRGVDDGLTRYLRTRFPPDRYAGIELEINQRLLQARGHAALYRLLAESLLKAAQHTI